MISEIKFKRNVASIDIFGIVIGKLYYRKKLWLIFLLKVNKGLKISF